ncbi:alpha/beta fold hydrolase [Metabacillus fastidiosus]|uniref:Alpha/beta hydrolase n=1 Tax=Metabacillus fastidiosus TaxID=1458 RepID=A0ABU6P387_9BACI|nr:alpha/beta hydrolase [Metabacillus fastidiosus]MED4403383.1 alpha/beta hydrolase [Metabacillus fastidiosus]MED4453979.1 alpha/beta hydrolase [Metabacillus fastidiosus]MED4460737.1 alpha/beta hydrolase [Metabacillus fastidiosus]
MNNIFVRNNVKIIGEGEKVIIFGHGFGCDQNMWRFITPHFEKEFRLVLFDYVGSGKSDLTAYNREKYSNLHGYKTDLLEIIEALNVEKVIFIGHSVSSMIGMLASIERPECFESLIMIGPSPRYLNDENGYSGGFDERDVIELLNMMEMNFIGWASYLAPIAMNNPDQPMLSQELEASFCSTDPVITRQFAEATFFSDHREDLLKATVPSLILQCAEDSIVPVEVGEYLHRYLKNSTFRMMEAKGHYPHLSHPEETTRFIKEYLSFF